MEKAKQRVSNLGYGPVAALLVSIGVYILAQAFVIVLVVLATFVAGGDEVQSGLESVWAQFGAGLLTSAAMLWMLSRFLKQRGTKWTQIGLKRPEWRDSLVALIGFGSYLVIIGIVLTVIVPVLLPGVDLDQQQEIGFASDTGGAALILVFAALVILPPITEEILIRGFFYTGLRSKLSFWPAALASSVIFGLAHLQFNDGQAPLWSAVIDTFVLGLLLAYLRERTKSLWPSIGVHFLKNSLAFMILFVFTQ